jgi:single-strand DNA-binding protein
MSRGFNQALLLGRLAAPPEQLQTKNGKLFLKATIAVSVAQKNAEGIGEERTSFVPVTIFGRQADVFLKYVHKGDMVYLVGRLDSSEWKTQEGQKRLNLSFVVEQLNLLPNNKENKAKPAETPSGTTTPKRSDAPQYDENGDPDNIPF